MTFRISVSLFNVSRVTIQPHLILLHTEFSLYEGGGRLYRHHCVHKPHVARLLRVVHSREEPHFASLLLPHLVPQQGSRKIGALVGLSFVHFMLLFNSLLPFRPPMRATNDSLLLPMPSSSLCFLSTTQRPLPLTHTSQSTTQRPRKKNTFAKALFDSRSTTPLMGTSLPPLFLEMESIGLLPVSPSWRSHSPRRSCPPAAGPRG